MAVFVTMQKDILFIDAACKAREKYLLGKDKLYRLSEAGSYDEGMRLLREYGFGKSAPEGARLCDIIFSEEEDLIAFVREYAPKGGTKYFFLLPYDFMNAEALLKCRKLSLSDEKYLTHEGALTIDCIRGAVNGKPCGIKEIDEAISVASALFEEKAPSGAEVDAVFTAYLYKAYKRLVTGGAAKEIIRTEAGLKNISVALRAESREEYDLLKIPCGTLSAAEEDALLTGDADKISDCFKGSYLYDYVSGALRDIGGPLVAYEKLADGYALERLKKTRYFLHGTEPYLLYVLYRKADIRNVRFIMVSIQNGADSKTIKNKLRSSYEG